MGNVITKLNLNRTPNLVENNSLVFAKNIRIDIDGSIHKDYSINPMSIVPDSKYDKLYDNIFIRIISIPSSLPIDLSISNLIFLANTKLLDSTIEGVLLRFNLGSIFAILSSRSKCTIIKEIIPTT